jgi:hypothetical protein
MTEPKKKRGGDRRSLDGGATPPSQFRLGQAAEGALDELAARSGLRRSEVVRRLVTHPDAPRLLLDPGAAVVVDRAAKG